ncbi:end-filament protein [Sulfolobus virus Kamchatka 1]|uniref:ORF B793 n=1 Tax=Sulfolobus virus Kamchatka 1 TaxID=248496 RepID=Q6TDL0_9VIRU|nr:end-filament protein [Sulfolobus virus Kamchatka 1]AAQ94388.1 ORF B793 [Sulfolobus virus Kamchatka 1]
MKWGLLFSIFFISLFSLNSLALLIGGGGPNNSGAGVYTQTITVNGGTVSTKVNGSTLSTAPWLNPTYVSIYNTYYLQVLPNQEYITNNVSLSLSSSQIALNVTWLLASSSNTGSYGSIAIGYGVNFPSGFTGSYAPALPYASDGIVVYMEKGSFPTYRLFVYFDGVKQLNVSVGSISVGQQIGLGFWYLPASNQLYVYYYNGTLKTFSITPGLSLNTINSNYVIDAQNVGPGYGYGQWVIVSYQYFTQVTAQLTVSYFALAYNIYHFLMVYAGAGNPVNISGALYSISGIVSQKNFTITGIQQGLAYTFNILGKSNGLYLLYTGPIEGNPPTWYVNVTIGLQIVTSQVTINYNLTIPVIVEGYALYPSVNLPSGTYLSGQTISFALTNIIGYPSNLGYYTAVSERANVSINGVTYPIPYSFTPIVQVPTTYYYTVIVTEGPISMIDYSGSFTVLPAQSYPVLFVTSYPKIGILGQTITITFQFTYNSPVANVTQSAFTQTSTILAFAYAKMVTTNAIVQFKAYWLSANDGLVIITQSGNNYLIPFNSSLTGLKFVNNSVNTLTFQIVTGNYVQISSSAGGVLTISNTSPIIGLGFYYGAGKLVLNWFFVSGIVLQSATANQAYIILTGTNPNTLSQYVTGYTNASGFGSVTLKLSYTPYELIDVYWYGVTYQILNISVSNTTTVSSTTTVNTTTLNYNYTNPFSNNISPNSSLYNFSQYQPWAEIIGIVVTVLIALLGWKFGGSAGASGGAVMGLIATAYLGLIPWYIFYIFIFGIALLLAKTMVDRFMGREE